MAEAEGGPEERGMGAKAPYLGSEGHWLMVSVGGGPESGGRSTRDLCSAGDGTLLFIPSSSAPAGMDS